MRPAINRAYSEAWVSVVSNSSRGRPWGNLEPYVSVGVLSTLGFSFCFASLLAPPPLSRFGRSPPAGREDFSACTVPQYFYPLVGSRKVAQGLMALPWLFIVPSGACRPIPGRPPPPGPPVFVPGVAPAPLDHPGYFPGGLPPPPDLPCVSRMGLPPPRTPPGNSDCRKHVKNKCPPNPGQGGQCMATDIITADSEPEVFPEQAQIGIASDVARPTSDGFREPWQAGHCVHP